MVMVMVMPRTDLKSILLDLVLSCPVVGQVKETGSFVGDDIDSALSIYLSLSLMREKKWKSLFWFTSVVVYRKKIPLSCCAVVCNSLVGWVGWLVGLLMYRSLLMPPHSEDLARWTGGGHNVSIKIK